jgi:hypothetical protein
MLRGKPLKGWSTDMKAKKGIKIVDRLDREIRVARGLVAAIHGINTADLGERESAGVMELAEVLVERLRAIRDGLATALRK